MKLLLVIPAFGCGGAEKVLSILANEWSNQSHSVEMIVFAGEPEDTFFLNPNIKVTYLKHNWSKRCRLMNLHDNIRLLFELRHLFKEKKPNLIISFLDTANIRSLLAACGLSIPVIISERVNPAYHNAGAIWNSLRRAVYSWSKYLVVQNEEVAAFFVPWFTSEIRIVPNPVCEAIFSHPPAEFNLPGNSIMAAGRLTYQKGFDILIKAFANAVEQNHDLKLVIFGEGAQRHALEHLAKDLKIDNKVSMPGKVPLTFATFRQAAVFVLSSRYEGSPNALCEAMACALPVVSTDCPSGPSVLIRDGYNGLLVPIDNPKAMAESILKIVDNKKLGEKLGNNALEIANTYSVPTIMARWNKLIQEAYVKDKSGS